MTKGTGKRTLTPQEEEVVEQLYKHKRAFESYCGYVTTAKPLTLKKWNGKYPVSDENHENVEVPPNTTLKIVMVSRLGDLGLTDDLKAVSGYHIRVDIDSDSIKDIRSEP